MLDGVGDAASVEVLLTAIHARSAPTAADDRTAAQRRFDALIELARRALDSGNLPDTGGERPHVTVTVDPPAVLGRPDRHRCRSCSPAAVTRRWCGW